GYIEGPNGEYDWCFTNQDYGMTAFFDRVDAIFLGRKSYEMSLGMEGADNSWMPPMTEYVFSNSLQRVKEGAILISGDLKTAVQPIKNEPGKDIWLFGGAELTASFLKENLVDELMLSIHPILLGSGKLLFGMLPNRVQLQLADTKTYDSGLVTLTYNMRS
ncbi:MAG: dihydrofolate reductase, partial [Saprospiraceae bacterium]|nr:dihydrofolate reductase [Saprospiraceae bacterium]